MSECSLPLNSFNKDQRRVRFSAKCCEVALEILSSEKSYLSALKLISQSFFTRLKSFIELPKRKVLLTPDELESIFLNISELRKIQTEFYKELKGFRGQGVEQLVANVSQSFVNLAPKLSAYNVYVRHQTEANALLHSLRQKNSLLQDFLQLTEVAENTTLNSLLIVPVQRVPRYILLLRELLRYCDEATVSANLKEALQQVERAAQEMNMSVKEHEMLTAVQDIEDLFKGRVALTDRKRVLVREGLILTRTEKDDNSGIIFRNSRVEKKSRFFLFNDMLLIADETTLGPLRLRRAVPLYLISLCDRKTHSLVLETPTKKAELVFDTSDEVEAWQADLQRCIARYIKDNVDKRISERELEFVISRDQKITRARQPGIKTQQHQSLIELQKSSRSMLDRRAPFPTLNNVGSSSSSHQQAMTGYLLKRGNSFRTWKKRFFVSDPEAKILRYFTNEEKSRSNGDALGFIDLEGCVVLKDRVGRWGNNAFEVYPNTSSRCYMLVADSEKARTEWLNHLRQFGTGDRVIEGWLLKKGAQLTGWKKRYFVCLQSTKEVLYFKNDTSSAGPNICERALGSIHLEGSRISPCSAQEIQMFGKGEGVFSVATSSRTGLAPSSQVNFKLDKTYVLSAGTQAQAQRWLRKLRETTEAPRDRHVSVDYQAFEELTSSYSKTEPTHSSFRISLTDDALSS